MGYKPQFKQYNLAFEDHPGLEVIARSATIGEITYVSKLQVNVNEPDDEKRLEVFQFFADRLVSWNMDHPAIPQRKGEPAILVCPACGRAEGDALPSTVEGMLCLELGLVMSIIIGWISAIARVTPPKGMNSSNGDMITEEVMKRLENLQNPLPLPQPNFT